MKVRVDEERCRGHGSAGACAPTCSPINDDGYAEVLVPEVPPDRDAAREAIDSCPESAIPEI